MACVAFASAPAAHASCEKAAGPEPTFSRAKEICPLTGAAEVRPARRTCRKQRIDVLLSGLSSPQPPEPRLEQDGQYNQRRTEIESEAEFLVLLKKNSGQKNRVDRFQIQQ